MQLFWLSGWQSGQAMAFAGVLAVNAPGIAVEVETSLAHSTRHGQMPQLESAIGQASTAKAGVEQAILNRVNAERQQVGIDTLAMNDQLNQAAQRLANDLAIRGRLSHTGSDGSTMQMRIEDTGYRWSTIGENIAMGQSSPEAVMTAWMGSSGHRQNILNPTFSELGVGYVENGNRQYWVQVFASPQ